MMLLLNVLDCVAEVDTWMDYDRLKLNTDKTQIIWFNSRQWLTGGLIDIEVTPLSSRLHLRRSSWWVIQIPYRRKNSLHECVSNRL